MTGKPGDAEELRVSVFRQELEFVLRGHDRVDDLRRAAVRRARRRAAAAAAASPSTGSPSCRKPARTLINTVPAISVFFKPRMSGTRYLKELEDRAVITWSLTEPVGGVQDMTWTPTVNRFQAVLRKDGTIEMSYDEVAAQDAIVGIYPMVTGGAEKEIATIAGEENAAVAPHLNIKSVKLAAVDGLFLKATIETRGPVLPESDPAMAGIAYRVCLDAKKPAGDCTQNAHADAIWTIQAAAERGGRGGGGGPRYTRPERASRRQ